MNIATAVGLDIAKSVFQVHGADAQGRPAFRKRLARGKVLEFFATIPPCRVGLEACGGAHHWARALTKLGHEVRLMPPQYVRPYVKTNKHDAADAEACCEAVTRPGMRFVPVKSEGQQALLMLHKIRDRLIAERTGTIMSTLNAGSPKRLDEKSPPGVEIRRSERVQMAVALGVCPFFAGLRLAGSSA